MQCTSEAIDGFGQQLHGQRHVECRRLCQHDLNGKGAWLMTIRRFAVDGMDQGKAATCGLASSR